MWFSLWGNIRRNIMIPFSSKIFSNSFDVSQDILVDGLKRFTYLSIFLFYSNLAESRNLNSIFCVSIQKSWMSVHEVSYYATLEQRSYTLISVS